MIDLEGGVSEVVQADVTDEKSCKMAVAKAIELFGKVDILVNIGEFLLTSRGFYKTNKISVGVGGTLGDATKLDLTAWERDFKINVTSMVLMCRHTIPEMRKNGRGAIVNMSSVSGRKSFSLFILLIISDTK
jgi:NAD(P)-dependent dehydrogenase (short-subunit alcohol dehydrogenase family)